MKLFKIIKRFEVVLIIITVLLSAQVVRADEYTYDDNGRITQVEHEDGSSTVYSYDDNGNLLSVETVSPTKKENSNNNNTNENQGNISSDNKEQKPSENKEEILTDNKEPILSDNKEQKNPDNQEQQQVVNTVPDNPENNSKPSDGESLNKKDNQISENKKENIDPANIESQESDKLDVKKTDKNSSTGDSTPIILLMILMGISLSAILVIRRRKRY